jgi:hypothetical protein
MPRLRAEAQERARRRAVDGPRRRALAFAKLTAFRERLGLIGGTAASDVALGADLETRNMEVFREVLRLAKARVAAWNDQLHVVYLPEWSSYAGIESWGTAKRQDALGLVRDLGIPLIDVDPAFRAQGDPLALFPFRGVGHYNEAGPLRPFYNPMCDEEVRRAYGQLRAELLGLAARYAHASIVIGTSKAVTADAILAFAAADIVVLARDPGQFPLLGLGDPKRQAVLLATLPIADNMRRLEDLLALRERGSDVHADSRR